MNYCCDIHKEVAIVVDGWQRIQSILQRFDPQLGNGNSYRLCHDEEGTAHLTAYTDYRGSWEMRREVSDVLQKAAENGAPMLLMFQPREALGYI